MEFYLSFFETIDPDLLNFIEKCRSTGRLYESINTTFIALIPKVDSPQSFSDFRPISPCNCLYKIIAKIIANRIKLILSDNISSEQFSFLHNRQVHETIVTAQEALHSIKLKNLKGAILKIDLSKAFDHINWLYIRMILTHLGFPIPFIQWIICCITSVSFSAHINGSASYFFHAKRELRQGCPLSPLLFLIVMEGLSNLISFEKRARRLQGFKITNQCILTHLLFVDDVLIFLNGGIHDFNTLSNVVRLFCTATGMEINQPKSTVTFSAGSP